MWICLLSAVICILPVTGLCGERILEHPDHAMIRYSLPELLSQKHQLGLNIRVRETLRSLHLLRRPKYVHRGSQRNFNITGTDIKVLCSRPACTDIKQNISRGVCPANLCYPQQVSTTYSDKVRPGSIRFAHLNVRSLNKKSDLLYDIILDKKLDVFCISETWHQQNDFLNLNLCAPPG